MPRRYAVIAAGCVAIGLFITGAANEGKARGPGGGGAHFGGGGFGGGHFGGMGAPGGMQSFRGFSGGQIGAPRFGTPQFRGLGGGHLAAPRLGTRQFEGLGGGGRFAAPRLGTPGPGTFRGGHFNTPRFGTSRFGTVRGGQFRLPSTAQRLNRLNTGRFARDLRGPGPRGPRSARAEGLNGRERGLYPGIAGNQRRDVFRGPGTFPQNAGRNAFTRFHERALAGHALARGLLPPQAFAARGPLNTAAFRHGNGFESRVFGGHPWRGRDRRVRFIWTGGVFWPFLFGDYLSYAIWPGAYAEPFWTYGSDSILWGSLWPNGGYGGESYAGEGGAGAQSVPSIGGGEFTGPIGSEGASLCSGFAPGVTDLPVARLEEIIKPTPEQREALNELRAAASKAARILQASCADRAPVTPVARLDAMEQRLGAMEQAITIIRGPLERLYGLLSEEQIGRLENAATNTEKSSNPLTLNLTELCSSESGLTNVPADEIARTLTLTDEQQFDLNKLKQAAADAAEQLRASCPSEVPSTIGARLQDSYRRIAALIQAIEAIRPAMGVFYASLSDQQKAALNASQANQSARR